VHFFIAAETHNKGGFVIAPRRGKAKRTLDAHWGRGESPAVGPLLITARNHIFEVLRCSQSDKFKAEIEKHAEMAALAESGGVGLGEKRRKRFQRALVLCSISKIGRLSTKTKATSTSKQIPS
jgi:hypothetical protein